MFIKPEDIIQLNGVEIGHPFTEAVAARGICDEAKQVEKHRSGNS